MKATLGWEGEKKYQKYHTVDQTWTAPRAARVTAKLNERKLIFLPPKRWLAVAQRANFDLSRVVWLFSEQPQLVYLLVEYQTCLTLLHTQHILRKTCEEKKS
ncbi:hypothetical protein AVEN_186573-1 [Araneus ventricosus]|uniref:Uncharacterized protein n=1 Tax=Araneus ventricosus TaxID=182803 RepID=A0A4Y2PKB5_ARAVE|nr:hypothetical protein AVEN_186573-1 [Araneus ventricosus]